MTETTTLRTLLLPELESEFDKTRKIFSALPEGHASFKPAEKSMPFGRLAGHVAEITDYITVILTSPDVDVSALGMTPLVFETVPQLLAEFNHRADKTITTLKNTSDETFHQQWKLTFHTHPIFSGDRYTAYREVGLNQLIHHRGQLTAYLRLLDARVPGIYGPSADEKP